MKGISKSSGRRQEGRDRSRSRRQRSERGKPIQEINAWAEELGLDLSSDIIDGLLEISQKDRKDIMSTVDEKGVGDGGIRNPAGFIANACRKLGVNIGQSSSTAKNGKGGKASGKGTKSAQRAQELGLDLSSDALSALSSLSFGDAMELLDGIESKGRGKDGVRNPSSYVTKAVEAILSGGSKGKSAGKSAQRAAEMGLDLSQEALDALRAIALGEAYGILDDIGRKGTGKGGVRNPSNYIVASVNKILDSESPAAHSVGNNEPSHDPPRKGGGKSAALAAKLGIELDPPALDALACMSMRDARELLEHVAEKGTGKGGIRNPTGYIIRAAKTWGVDLPKSTLSQIENHYVTEKYDKTPAERERTSPAQHSPVGPEVSMETRVLEFNKHRRQDKIDVEALMALKTLPRFQAHGILDILEKKGSSVRDPSNYVQATVAKKIREGETREGEDPVSEKHGPRRFPLTLPKLLRPNRQRSLPVGAPPVGAPLEKRKMIWRGALVKMKPPERTLAPSSRMIRPKKFLVPSTKCMIRPPKKWVRPNVRPIKSSGKEVLVPHVSKSKADEDKRKTPLQKHTRESSRSRKRSRESGEPKKVKERSREKSRERLRDKSIERSKPRSAGSVGGRGREIAKLAKDLHIKLSFDAVEALARVDSEKANHILEKVANKDSKIENPSTYVLSAISRGLKTDRKIDEQKDDAPPAKRASKESVRPSAAPDSLMKQEMEDDW